MRLGKSSCILFHSSLFETKTIDSQGRLAKVLGLFSGDLIIYGTWRYAAFQEIQDNRHWGKAK